METYRLYFMSADGTHIDRFEPIEARDDDDAIRFAEIYIGRQALELWLKSRKVFTFESEGAAAGNPQMAFNETHRRRFAPFVQRA